MKKILIMLLTVFITLTCIHVNVRAIEDEVYTISDKLEIGSNAVKNVCKYKNYLYYSYSGDVYEYNMDTGEEKNLDLELNNYYIDIAVKDNILYVGTVTLYGASDDDRYYVIGLDLDDSFNIVYEHSFAYDLGSNGRIIVDSDHNFYFKNRNKVMIIDKEGNTIDEIVYTEEVFPIELNNLTPNDRVLFCIFREYNDEGWYREWDCLFSLKNHKFISEDLTLLGTRSPIWSFSEDSLYGANQYGEVVKFDYNADNELEFKMSLMHNIGNGDTGLLQAGIDDNYAYLYNGIDTLSFYNLNTYSIDKNLKIDETIKVKCIYPYDNKVIIMYAQGSKYYISSIDKDDFLAVKEITINTHSTLNKTKEEVKAYYNENKITAKYSSENIYEELPVLTAPYYEGKLKDNYINDILKQLNMFRWLSGLNSVTLNEQYMPRSQKGALIQAASNELTHTPSKLPGMSEEFYQEAFAGTYAGYDYEGNCLVGYDLADIIKSFVDDDNNLYGGVGHRSSMLSIYATSMSFGVAHMNDFYHYNATSIYTDSTMKTNNEDYYAWPNAGYCPIELTNIYADWSIRLNDKYSIKTKDVVLTYNGKEYKAKDIGYDFYNNTLYYSLPEELKTLIVKNYKFINNTTVQVKVGSLTDKSGNLITIEYPVKLFTAEDKLPFTDVSDKQWYHSWVKEAYNLGLMTGATETLFKPNANMNRGMVAIVFHRMEGSPKVDYSPVFPDVANNQYYTTSVLWAKTNGVINGYKDGTFKPLRNVSREEMATMIYNFAKYKGLNVKSNKDITYFNDYAKITPYARVTIAWAVENGLMSGKDNGVRLDPLGHATRAECCKMLVQAYKVIYK